MSRIEQAESLFHQALALPSGAERTRWVEEQCRNDAEMLAEVLSLLAAKAAMESGTAAIHPAEAFVPTAQFGAYRAVELLAQGGMSSVYRAERVDGQAAGDYLRVFHKSHSVELGDALIAASASLYGLWLWSQNRKHYPMKGMRFYLDARVQ